MPLDEFGANLESMVQYLQSVDVPAERVVLITPPPLWEAAWERECLAKGKQCLATQVPTRMLVLVEGASRDPSYNVSHGRHEPGGHRWLPRLPTECQAEQQVASGHDPVSGRCTFGVLADVLPWKARLPSPVPTRWAFPSLPGLTWRECPLVFMLTLNRDILEQSCLPQIQEQAILSLLYFIFKDSFIFI